MNRLKNTPQVSATTVAMNVGTMMSDGLCEPRETRIAITVAGMIVMALVLIVRNMHIASVAVPACLFNLLSSSIALRPSGVAALERPSMLAAMFESIAP